MQPGTKQLNNYRRYLVKVTATKTTLLMMMMVSIIFMWLLPLTGSSAVTSAQHNNLTNVTAGEEVQKELTTKRMTTNRMSVLEQEISAITAPTTEDESSPSPLTSRATPPKTISTSTEPAAAASIGSAWTDFTSSTDRSSFQDQTSITTSQTSPSTKPSQRHSTGAPPASQSTGNNLTSPSAAAPQPATIPSTETTSTQPENDTSTSSHPGTSGDAAHFTSSYKTPAARPLTSTSTATKEQNDTTGTNHGTVVATLIGGALFVMMLGFLLIYIKKQRLQKQKMTTTDWAGPSPFLEGRTEKDKTTLRSSNRISLSSFLPQRLSKRMSLLPETDEELQDMTPGDTFGGKRQEGTSGHSVDGENEQEKTEHHGSVPYIKGKGEDAEAGANSALETSNSITDPSNIITDLSNSITDL